MMLPILVLVAVAAADLWVYADASALEERGTSVIFATGFVTLDTPQAWGIACVVLFVVAFPLYVTARRQPAPKRD